jgi:hypothetical protein
VVHHGLPGQQQVVLPGQVRHEQECFRPEYFLEISFQEREKKFIMFVKIQSYSEVGRLFE